MGGVESSLNELFYLLSSHHLNPFVFQASVRWENHTSPIFCLHLLSFNPSYQYTDGHMSFLTFSIERRRQQPGVYPASSASMGQDFVSQRQKRQVKESLC